MTKRLLLPLFLSLLISTAEARTDRFSVVSPIGVQKGDWIFFPGSPTLGNKKWEFSQVLSYGFHPLGFTVGGARFAGIVDHLLVQQLGVGYGVADPLNLEVFLPIVWWNRFTPPAVGATRSDKIRLGDVSLQARYSFRNRNEDPFGFAVVPFLTVPTGSEATFVGDRLPTGGLRFVIDKNLESGASVGLNVGARVRERVVIQDLDTSSQFLAGAGVSFRLPLEISASVEIDSETALNHFYRETVSSPTELLVGLKRSFRKTGINVGLGGGVAVVGGAGAPLFRTFAGFTYSPPSKQKVTKVEETTVSFSFDSARLTAESRLLLDREVETLKAHPSVRMVISGHTDSAGPRRYNHRLSIRRAESVRDYLVRQGIDPSRVRVEGRGEDQPVADNRTTRGRHLNRRVEMKTETPQH